MSSTGVDLLTVMRCEVLYNPSSCYIMTRYIADCITARCTTICYTTTRCTVLCYITTYCTIACCIAICCIIIDCKTPYSIITYCTTACCIINRSGTISEIPEFWVTRC
ncbi:hypothetical protein DL98DRAFT_173375 [Cadophora sp. DSE1049]|nr:hypothetical protein DL98DRAFT_173375 [Cadophora sp. DSE1049]